MKLSGAFEKVLYPMILSSMVFSSGCLATQDWVENFVNEKVFPVDKRVSETQANLTKTNDRVTNLESQVQAMQSQLNEANSKADRALENLQKLKVDRKLVLDMKQGAFFASNSTVLTNQAKKEIDSFISDLAGESSGTAGLLFVVAGFTDDVGGEKYNYDLARIRAENAASYLTAQKKIDPGQLVVLSYGEKVPVADNKTAAGRAKNRRIEILVYRDAVTLSQTQAGSSATR